MYSLAGAIALDHSPWRVSKKDFPGDMGPGMSLSNSQRGSQVKLCKNQADTLTLLLNSFTFFVQLIQQTSLQIQPQLGFWNSSHHQLFFYIFHWEHWWTAVYAVAPLSSVDVNNWYLRRGVYKGAIDRKRSATWKESGPWDEPTVGLFPDKWSSAFTYAKNKL